MDIKGLNEASRIIHEANKQKGFYDNPREVGTLLMLVVSELSEALEAHRKKTREKVDFRYFNIRLKELKDSLALPFNSDISSVDALDSIQTKIDNEAYSTCFECYIKDSFEDEIADAMIRLLDLCGYLNINIEKHIELKLKYNEMRAHKHGKRY